jgi:CheY-like chemotaxis protein
MVLMDIKMPVMGGYEATRKIKSMKPGLPVVALTAYALPGDREKALEAGCDDYMAKPLSLKEFLELVKKHL